MTNTALAVEALLAFACCFLICALGICRIGIRYHKAKVQLLEEALRIAAVEQLVRWNQNSVSSSDVVLTAQLWIESAKKRLFGAETSLNSNRGEA